MRTKVQRRRLQILAHSFIYYKMNRSIIPDSQFDRWCRELVQLQKKYPGKDVVYYEAFKDFDGSTGYDLPYYEPWVIKKGLQLLNYHDTINSSQKDLKNNRKKEKKMARKAKWLEEGTQLDLLGVISEALEETENTTKINRGKKAVDELLERTPVEGETSITDLLVEAKELITEAQSIYDEEEEELEEIMEELEAEEEELEEEEEEDEEEVEDLGQMKVAELRAYAEELDIDTKGLRKNDLIKAINEVLEGEEEEDYEDEEEEDYEEELEEDLEDMTVAELKKYARELGISIPAKVRKPVLIDLILEAEEDEEEDYEDEEEEELEDYDDMTLADLKEEARERGIRVSKRLKRDQIISMLEADDEEA